MLHMLYATHVICYTCSGVVLPEWGPTLAIYKSIQWYSYKADCNDFKVESDHSGLTFNVHLMSIQAVLKCSQ